MQSNLLYSWIKLEYRKNMLKDTPSSVLLQHIGGVRVGIITDISVYL
jgi:hypothetical protein